MIDWPTYARFLADAQIAVVLGIMLFCLWPGRAKS